MQLEKIEAIGDRTDGLLVIQASVSSSTLVNISKAPTESKVDRHSWQEKLMAMIILN